jgi:ABC-type nitrate/sulfonate/bicarbonate transport system permease component
MHAKLISPILLLALWEVGVRLEWLDPRLVAPPSLVVTELWRLIESGDLVAALAVRAATLLPPWQSASFASSRASLSRRSSGPRSAFSWRV